MVFYTTLPIELWFIIYKMEHNTYQLNINNEIEKLHNEVAIANKELILTAELGEQIDLWNYSEWLVFRKQRDKMSKWWQSY